MRKHTEVIITSIKQHSPISVSLDGAAEAIGVVRDTIVPWRRKHNERMTRLSEEEKQAEIEIKKAEALESQARASKEKQEAERLAAESTLHRAEAEKVKLENEKLRLELDRARIQLALEVLEQLKPDLSESERMLHVIKYLPSLRVLTDSPLQITAEK
jgi:hypothetical protein